MRALLLAVLLFAIPAHAESYLTIQTECGEPKYVFAILDGTVLEASWESIMLNSDLLAFFRKVLEELPVKDGERVYGEVMLDKLLGHTCPVSI